MIAIDVGGGGGLDFVFLIAAAVAFGGRGSFGCGGGGDRGIFNPGGIGGLDFDKPGGGFGFEANEPCGVLGGGGGGCLGGILLV